MTHQYHFRSSIDPDTVEERMRTLGFETRAEYLRALLRNDIKAQSTAVLYDGGQGDE